jgi:hypothetical protein
MKVLRAHAPHRPAAVGQPQCFREATEAGRDSSGRPLTLSKQDVLQVEHGCLCPALRRLQNRGWIASFWGTSENNRKATYYRLTVAGKKQLVEQSSR